MQSPSGPKVYPKAMLILWSFMNATRLRHITRYVSTATTTTKWRPRRSVRGFCSIGLRVTRRACERLSSNPQPSGVPFGGRNETWGSAQGLEREPVLFSTTSQQRTPKPTQKPTKGAHRRICRFALLYHYNGVSCALCTRKGAHWA
jgi:hypothetical protein